MLVRYIDDGMLPADNNWVENQIRPIALGRSNWLFAGSLRAGQRAAAIMSLVHSTRLNGHDPLRLPPRCARAAAHPPGKPLRRVAVASLAADLSAVTAAAAATAKTDPLKTGSPDAYATASRLPSRALPRTRSRGGRHVFYSPESYSRSLLERGHGASRWPLISSSTCWSGLPAP